MTENKTKGEIASDISDECLVEMIIKGDKDKFRILVNRHRPLIDRILYTVLNGDMEEIADARQEVLIALYKALPGYKQKAAFTTFLYRISKNRAIDHLRKIRKHTHNQQPLTSQIVHKGPGPQETLATIDVREQLTATLNDLKKEDRLLFIMVELEGMKLSEAADMLNKPLGTIKSRLHRIKRTIRKKLEVQIG